MIKTDRESWQQRFYSCREESLALYSRDSQLILFLFDLLASCEDETLLTQALQNAELVARLRETRWNATKSNP